MTKDRNIFAGFAVLFMAAMSVVSASCADKKTPADLGVRYFELGIDKSSGVLTEKERTELNEIKKIRDGWEANYAEDNEAKISYDAFWQAVYGQYRKIAAEVAEELSKQGASARADKLNRLAENALYEAYTTAKIEADYLSGNVAPESDFEVKFNDAGDGVIITGYTGKGGRVLIPATIQGYPVREISNGIWWNPVFPMGNRGFRETDVVSVVIPEGVTEIGMAAFRDCKKLTSVVIPESITTIRESTFEDCKNLATVSIPESMVTIENLAFESCRFTDITIPDSVIKIGSGAFANCPELENVTISPVSGRNWNYLYSHGERELLTNSEHSAFQGCSKLSLKSQEAIRAAGYKGHF